MIRLPFAFSATVLLSVAVPDMAFAVSFDCTKAKSLVEYAICTNAELSSSDDQVAARYKEITGTAENKDAVKADQRKWLANRNDCKDIDCLKEIYIKRISDLGRNATQAKKDAPAGSEVLGTDQPEWPFPLEMLRETYLYNEFANEPVFWRNQTGIENVYYRESPNKPELQQIIRTTKGSDLLFVNFVRLQSFEVTSGKRGATAQGHPTYDYTYRAKILLTEEFEVVPQQRSNRQGELIWLPRFELGHHPELNYAVYVKKGAVLELTGRSFNMYDGPPQPPQEPNSQQEGSASWWKK